ncbi:MULTISPECIES: TauD/TfdA family dioxygenase [Streptomyces]|uniref:TauD/TfdA family dioxygenase n=1 Tax=Streptomyces TaxID=1883 RepID=UPI0012FEDC40|nr:MULTISPECIES: TauD/TfdA family dioxygenase [Streptomyces]
MDKLLPLGDGWRGEFLAKDEGLWRIPMPPEATAELVAAARAEIAANRGPDLGAPRPTGLPHSTAFAAELRARLDGPGAVVVTGFPVAGEDPREAEMAYWLLGLLLGRPVSQSRKGDLLGRVEDRGADIASPVQRGYESSAELPFHVDRTDVIGLLCIRPAHSGGLSRLASSKTVHDLLFEEHPELLAELYEPFPNDRRGEEQPGEQPWSGIPVFSRTDGHFAMRYVRRFITGSQRHDSAPRLTEAQLAAMDAIDEILGRPGVALDMELREGDLQLINNFSILHARTAFTGDGGGRNRLLLRLWLAFSGSPALPEGYASLYGATAAGSYRGGVWPTGTVPADLGRPTSQLG